MINTTFVIVLRKEWEFPLFSVVQLEKTLLKRG